MALQVLNVLVLQDMFLVEARAACRPWAPHHRTPGGSTRLEADSSRGAAVDLELIGTAGLGDNSYVLVSGAAAPVGGAGRTDLLGPALTDRLTRDQFRSLRRLAALPDAVAVLPTHGAGSFCGTGTAPRERTSTLSEERVRNPALAAPDEDTFVRLQ